MGRATVDFPMYSSEMPAMIQIKLHNTRTRRREAFTPINPGDVKVYVCGPTVYDRAHLGNARPVVVFDVLIRLLRGVYPRVTYVRNITDVDDKINSRFMETGEPISAITTRTTQWFHDDMAALGALPPDVEPRATAHIPEIIAIIQRLIQSGHGYEAQGHVLFAVESDPNYGKFSGRSAEELIAGARVEVAPYKRAAGDFVLWKPSPDELPGWDSPWGRGRPGWHIECSAMSWKHLGTDFDIHGGGSDLIFPHHENEIAQSTCAFPGSHFARYWVHNAMLLVNGEKMSKSRGNFFTVAEVLRRVPGEALRFLLLKTHYRSTLDFTDSAIAEAKRELDRFYRALEVHSAVMPADEVPDVFLSALAGDLNTPAAIAALHRFADAALAGDAKAAASLRAAGSILGIFSQTPSAWFSEGIDQTTLHKLVTARNSARERKDYAEADRIRSEIESRGIVIEDGPNNSYTLRKR